MLHSPTVPSPPLPSVLAIGALYAGSERGLAGDLLSARALGLAPLPVCTQLVMAGHGRVTDVTDVPTDTVAAQIEHTVATVSVAGVHVGALAGHQTVATVFDAIATLGVPVVLNLVASGPSGETVLSAQGVDAVAERLGLASVVTLSRLDAEFFTRGQIESLDDAQVAAQRIVGRGAQAVLLRCGSLPYRFYDAADDPGLPADQGDGAPAGPYAFDLLYDGDEFSLFEAPLVAEPVAEGASSAFAMAVLSGLMRGDALPTAVQSAKRFATEAVRRQSAGPEPRLAYHWETSR